MERYVLIFILCFAGSLIQGSLSFGYGIFVMSVLSLILPLKTTSVLVAISSLFISFTVCCKLRGKINYKAIWLPLAAGLLFIPIGVYILGICNENALKKILGASIILMAVFFLTTVGKTVPIKTNIKNQLLAGMTSGIFNGLFNMGGPPLVFYLAHTIEDSLSYKASLEFIFIVSGVIVLISHGICGNFTAEIIPYVILSFFATIIGSILGLKIFARLDKKILTSTIDWLMLGLGVILILN